MCATGFLNGSAEKVADHSEKKTQEGEACPRASVPARSNSAKAGCYLNGVTRDSIEANQRSLRLRFVDWHGDMPKERRPSLLHEVFPDT